MSSIYDLIVIGAGPAGMMAAGVAASRGADVLLIDKNRTVGRKLSITGKGRCNITNNCTINEFIDSVVSNKNFLYSAAHTFSPQDTINFFEDLGLQTKTERGRRVFPYSDRASDVVKSLQKFAFVPNCDFKTEKVREICKKEKHIFDVKCCYHDFSAKNVIIACGGASYPITGSNGDGYKLAQKLGHYIVAPKPSLVPIVCEESFCKDLQGLSLRNITLSVFRKNKLLYRQQGEMLFTHFGVSGPLVLSASSHILKPKGCQIIIDLKPALTYEQLDIRIQMELSNSRNKFFVNSLYSLLPKKLIPVFVQLSSIPGNKVCNSITKLERSKIVNLLKNFKLTINKFRPLNEAIVTRGGVSTREIDPKTMQSKLVDGLYFAGEVIDVDAYTGGYNLQIAFSTGYTAGSSIEY